MLVSAEILFRHPRPGQKVSICQRMEVGTTEKVLFKRRTLFLGQSTQKVRLDRLVWIGGAATNLHNVNPLVLY